MQFFLQKLQIQNLVLSRPGLIFGTTTLGCSGMILEVACATNCNFCQKINLHRFIIEVYFCQRSEFGVSTDSSSIVSMYQIWNSYDTINSVVCSKCGKCAVFQSSILYFVISLYFNVCLVHIASKINGGSNIFVTSRMTRPCPSHTACN